jgi:hypothetical protein
MIKRYTQEYALDGQVRGKAEELFKEFMEKHQRRSAAGFNN